MDGWMDRVECERVGCRQGYRYPSLACRIYRPHKKSDSDDAEPQGAPGYGSVALSLRSLRLLLASDAARPLPPHVIFTLPTAYFPCHPALAPL